MCLCTSWLFSYHMHFLLPQGRPVQFLLLKSEFFPSQADGGCVNVSKCVYFFSSYKALGVRLFLRHLLKPRGEKSSNNSTTQRKLQEHATKPPLRQRLSLGWENQSPHLWQDSVIPKSSMDGITLFYHILTERCEAFIVAICQGLLPGDVWEICCTGSPNLPICYTHNLLHKLTWWILNTFPRQIRLSWVVRFPGETTEAKLTLNRMLLQFYFVFLCIYLIHHANLCSHDTHIHRQFKHVLLFYTSKASVILFSLIWISFPSLFV